PPEERKPLAWTIDLRRLRIEDGALDLANQEGPVAQADGVQVDASGRLAGTSMQAELRRLAASLVRGPERYDVQAALAASLDQDRVDARIRLATVKGLLTRGLLSLRGSARGPRDHITVDLGVDVPPRGTIRVSGWVGAPVGAPPRYDIETRIDRIDPHAIRANLKPGRLGGALHVHGDGTPLQPGPHLAPSLPPPPPTAPPVPIHSF